jgi:uracil-DNA glycosylase family 4
LEDAKTGPREPDRDCNLCPRLAAFRVDNRGRHPEFFNAPVPAFGPLDAELLVVGLAPGLKGANRTGRPFTGDYAGQLLYPTLLKTGLARGTFEAHADDGLVLLNCRVTNAVRCVPPENKPTTTEIRTCRDAFLLAELTALPRLRHVLALGRVAHETILAAFGYVRARYPFAHGARHTLPNGLWLSDSYHCSRYNTSTGRLTPDMFETVVARVARSLA